MVDNVKSAGQIEDTAIINAVWDEGANADPVGASWGGLRGPTRVIGVGQNLARQKLYSLY